MATQNHSFMYSLFLVSNTDHVLHDNKIPLHAYKNNEVELENLILQPLDYTYVNLDLIKTVHESAQKEVAKLVFFFMLMNFLSIPEATT